MVVFWPKTVPGKAAMAQPSRKRSPQVPLAHFGSLPCCWPAQRDTQRGTIRYKPEAASKEQFAPLPRLPWLAASGFWLLASLPGARIHPWSSNEPCRVSPPAPTAGIGRKGTTRSCSVGHDTFATGSHWRADYNPVDLYVKRRIAVNRRRPSPLHALTLRPCPVTPPLAGPERTLGGNLIHIGRLLIASLAFVALGTTTAHAGVRVGIGIGIGVPCYPSYRPYYYGYPYPYYAADD